MKIIIAILFFNFFNPLSAQEMLSNTLTLDSLSLSPKASLNDISWLAGHWRGEAFGGIAEEIWSPPFAGSMMCVFRLSVNDTVKFYELITITEENESLIMRLKHFHKDLKGWEEKNVTVDFPLVKVTPKRVYFDGFTLEKLSENEINMYVRIGGESGTKEVIFNYGKVN